MSSSKYFKELEKNLKDLDKKSRNDIIKELSYTSEDESYENLVKRFGSPEEMASNYLENLPKKSKKSRILLYAFLILIFIFLVLYISIKSYLSDPFDFSKYNAKTINEKINKPWHTLENIAKVDIEQSKVIIYFSQNKTFEYFCKSDKSNIAKSGTFFIKQSYCYLKIPKKAFEIKVFQSNLVLIKPLEELSIEAKQSSIEFVSKNQKYNFDFEKKQSYFKNFVSNKDGIKIKSKLSQSSFDRYEY